MGKFDKPEDVFAVYIFLAPDQARFATGSDYGADGAFGA